jgi:hypothetical protein
MIQQVVAHMTVAYETADETLAVPALVAPLDTAAEYWLDGPAVAVIHSPD